MVQNNLIGSAYNGVNAIDKLNTEERSEIPTLLKNILPLVDPEVMAEHSEMRAKNLPPLCVCPSRVTLTCSQC